MAGYSAVGFSSFIGGGLSSTASGGYNSLSSAYSCTTSNYPFYRNPDVATRIVIMEKYKKPTSILWSSVLGGKTCTGTYSTIGGGYSSNAQTINSIWTH